MEQSDLERLSKVVDAEFMAAKSHFRQIVSEERRLRQMLSGLGEQEQASRQQFQSELDLRSFGGDVAWHRWVSSTRKSLNTQLAKVLAKKRRPMKRSAKRVENQLSWNLRLAKFKEKTINVKRLRS